MAQEGSKRTRSFVPPNSVSVGDVSVFTGPIGIGVTYICTYSCLITAISNAYEVTEVTITGTTQTGSGNLASGFSMSLNHPGITDPGLWLKCEMRCLRIIFKIILSEVKPLHILSHFLSHL